MKRKVVKQGASTLMISLPTKWAKQFEITKGDELDVQEQGRRLVVSTQKEYGIDKTEINVDDLDPMILRTLAALYKAGYDEIKVTFSDPKLILEVQKSISKETSGYEIVEQGKNYCIIRNIEGGLEEGFDPILRRTFLLLLTMADDSMDVLKRGAYDELAPLRFLEESNNRFTTYCRRHLSKKGYKDYNKIQFIYHIIEQLERVADQYKYLFDYLMRPENKNLKLSKETLSYYAGLSDMLRTYYELFYKFDKAKLVKIGKLRKKLVHDIGTFVQKAPGKEAVVNHYLVVQMQLIFELLEPYLAMVL